MVPKLNPLINYLDSLNTKANLDSLEELLQNISVNTDDLKDYCIFGDSTYNRNPIKDSRWYSILLLCWRSGQFSPIHDHSGSSCAFKIIKGEATEILYKHVGDGLVEPIAKRLYREGDLCLAQDSDTHKIFNRSNTADLVTLHVYSPALHMRYYNLKPERQASEEHYLMAAS